MDMNSNNLLTGSQWGIVILFIFMCIGFFTLAVYIKYKHYYKYDYLVTIGLCISVALVFGSFINFMFNNREERITNFVKNAMVEDQKYTEYTKMKTALCMLNKASVYFEGDKTLQLIDSISVDTTLIFSNKKVYSFREIRFINK